MKRKDSRPLLSGASMAAMLWLPTAAFGQEAANDQPAFNPEEIVVTAQRRAESLQSVPIAVSAFSAETLQDRRLDSGADLQTQIPNVAFTRGLSGNYSFAIRGISSGIGGISSGVGVHQNGAPLNVNRLADADFYDLERLEVLRGPQGTLYGRNATAGVINLITARPTSEFSAEVFGEVASYDSFRTRAHLNIPLNDVFSVRLAGSMTRRDGFLTNESDGSDMDNRRLWGARATIGFTPAEWLRADLVIEHFEEKDSRLRYQKQYCITDPGATQVGNATLGFTPTNIYTRNLFSQGCLPGDINSPEANGAVNFSAGLLGFQGEALGLTQGDPFAGSQQSTDPRTFPSLVDPFYRVNNDLRQLHLRIDLGSTLTLTSTSSQSEDTYAAMQDYSSIRPTSNFFSTARFPGGVVNDPQLGPANFPLSANVYQGDSKEWSQEFRLQSDFDGSFNFDVGVIHSEYDNSVIFSVLSNLLSARAIASNGAIYVDPVAEIPPSGLGHNYYSFRTDSGLVSNAVSGEFYWKPGKEFKLTLGGRYTDDKVKLTRYGLLLLTPGNAAPTPLTTGSISNQQFTYRVSGDWSPDLSFTDQTLFYASVSTGYRNGGPNAAGPAPIYQPETVTAFEIGTRNVLFNRRLTLNLTAFQYDYSNYQISKALNRILYTENIDAKTHGLELETVWRPTDMITLNAQVGYLNAQATSGASEDYTNYTQGNPNLTPVRTSTGSGCVVPTTNALAAQRAVNTAVAALGPNPTYAQLFTAGAPIRSLCTAFGADAPDVQLDGKTLPQAPRWTVSLGAQLDWDFDSKWRASLRGDYYWRAQSYSRIFNTINDRVPAYDNVNVSLTVRHDDLGLDIQAFVKNLFDKDSITNYFLGDDSAGQYRNVFLLDPRTYGIAITQRF